MKVLAVRVHDELLAKAKIRAVEERISLQELVTQALETRLARKGGRR